MTEEQIERNKALCRYLRFDLPKAKMGANLPLEDEYENSYFSPPDEMAEYYGWKERDPQLIDMIRLSNLNDGDSTVEKSHREIADLIENNLDLISA